MKSNLAFDFQTSRSYDADGRLHVVDCAISKANICEYLGGEIPDAERLGLVADKIYRLYRDPGALRAAASSFNGLPLMDNHVAVSAANPEKYRVVGAVSAVRWVAPYLRASLSIWDADAIRRIEDGSQREISCAYRYTPIVESGSIGGERFDIRMTQIVGNHVALVEQGRAGSDVVVADSALDLDVEIEDDTGLMQIAGYARLALR